MNNPISRSVLLKAVKIIKQWHDFQAKESRPEIFKIYYDQSPEMKPIREVLGPYDKMKDEVIEATSEPTEPANWNLSAKSISDASRKPNEN